MALDAVKNFGKVEVSQGYDDVATSIILSAGDGAKLPNPAADGEFNLIWWNTTDYVDPSDDPNKEIVRCTARSTDTLTIARAQEGTAASTKNTDVKVYRMILGLTAKMITDIESDKAASGANADITSMTSLDDGGIPFSKVADLWVHFAKGYILGGFTTAVTAVIEDLIFSSETSQAIAATLDTAKRLSAGVNSSTKGYILGGYDTANTAVIEDLIFSSETSQAIAATLDTAKYEGAGVQYGYI